MKVPLASHSQLFMRDFDLRRSLAFRGDFQSVHFINSTSVLHHRLGDSVTLLVTCEILETERAGAAELSEPWQCIRQPVDGA